MEAESHLQLVDRFRHQTVDENFVKAAQSPVDALQAVHTLFHGEAGPGG
jgi:hypothetical protein